MRRWLKRVVILALLAALAAMVAVPVRAWWQQQSTPKYRTAATSRGRVETVVNSTGTVKPVRSVSVGAFTSGPIEKVLVDYNSVVKKGDLLAVIDSKLAQAALDRDQAALDRDQAAVQTQLADQTRLEALLLQAQNNEERARKLVAINKDYLSDTDMDQYHFSRLTAEAQVKLAKANVTQAEANVKQSEANVTNSRANLGYTKIASPEDGVVLERKVDPGQTVAASFQTPELFTIALEIDQHVNIYASVDEADVGQIRTAKERNRPVHFTVDAYPGDLFEGAIDQIRMNSTTTQNVVTYPVIIKAPNPDRKLMPGMTANISFQIEAKEDVLRVPVSALRFTPTAAQARPEDRRFVDAPLPGETQANPIPSASDKAERARKRQHRTVWVQDGAWLKAVPVVLGLVENQFAELVEGDLAENQTLVIGLENPLAPR